MAVGEERLPGAVLALCTHNAVRSPMLEALLKRAFGTKIYVQSAGVEDGELNPFAVEVMREIGLDISGHRARPYADLPPDSYDLIAALSKPAYALARDIAAQQSVSVEYWDTPEPPPLSGERPREMILEDYRRLRDDLIRHIGNRFGIATEALSQP